MNKNINKNIGHNDDKLINSNTTDFERKLIKECREDGMTDEEISAWLKEI